MLRRLLRPPLLLLFAGGAIAPAPLPAQSTDVPKGQPLRVLDARIGVNTRLGPDSPALPATQRGQAEPHLARSPLDPEVLLATFQDGRLPDAGAHACGYAVSHDGGLTWRRELIPSLTSFSGGRFNRATDPVAGIGPQGDFYLQTLASVQGAFVTAAVVLSRSTDQGVTWSSPNTIFQSTTSTPSPDKNWLAVQDYAERPNAGRLVATWTSFIITGGVTQSASLTAATSDDRGLTWSAPIAITPTGTRHQGTQPVFLPDGSLVVVYITFLNPDNITTIDLRCKRSLDGGHTYPADAVTIVPLINAWDDPQVREGVFLPSATVARQSGDLFVSYVALVGGTPRVLVTRSTNQGASWSAPVVVSDQPAGVSVMNATIAATPDGRTVSVFFMDKRDAPGGRDFVDFYVACSLDGGVTWQPNLRLSERSSDIRLGPPTSRGAMLGDYFGLVAPATPLQPFVALWCETRTGESEPFSVRFAPAPEPSVAAWRLARFRSADHTADGRSAPGSDPDGDGHANVFEYLLGTNPLAAEHGDVFMVDRSAGDTVSVSWTQRPDLADGPQFRASLPTGQSLESSGGRVPSIPPPDGLVWRTAEIRTSGPGAAALVYESTFDSLLGTRIAPLVVSSPATHFGTDARLINLSSRGRSGPGASQMIVGFGIDGNKSILVRAAGPALTGLGVSDALPDPQLSLVALASDLDLFNDNWSESTATAALFARLGAFPFAPDSRDAALSLPLGIQNYTAVVTDSAGRSGLALVEAYDADPVSGAPGRPRLRHLSTRGEVGAGADVLVAGFVLSGTQPRRLLIRATGPGLAAFEVSNPLGDPALTLYRGDQIIAQNDDWETGRSASVVAAVGASVGAFALNRTSLDAALVVTLPPGAYTVVISGADARTGLALVEIYDAD